MKSLLLVVMGLLLISSVASASEISFEPATGPGTVALTMDRDDYALTQNLSLQLVAGIFTCGNVTLGYTTDGWALRRMSLVYEFGIESPFCVSSVDWGIRRFVSLLDSIPGDIQVAVRLFTINETDPLLFANMVPLDSVMVPVTHLDNPVAPLTGTPKHTIFPDTQFDPTGVDLVVAVHYPEGYSSTPAFRFSPSGNSLGETLPGYVAFADCGYPDPVTPGDLGNTTPMVVFVVNGHTCPLPPVIGACCNHYRGGCTLTTYEDCRDDWLGPGVPCTPAWCVWWVPTEPKSWGAIKNLYR
jgi:hypothetical protein